MRDIQPLLLRAKKELYGYLNGQNISSILGQGYDFAELREYQPSDDIRHISWINSAKLGEPYIKKMHEERELHIAVCSLVDGRFLVGAKRELWIETLATLGYAAQYANDDFLSLLLNREDQQLYPPSKNIEQIEHGIRAIAQTPLINRSSHYAHAPAILLNRITQKSLLFIIGDFLDPIDLSILAQKHEVIAIIIRDESEEHPRPAPNTQLINPQNSQEIRTKLSPKAIRHYQAQLKKHDQTLKEHLYQYGIGFTKIQSQKEILPKLIELLR